MKFLKNNSGIEENSFKQSQDNLLEYVERLKDVTRNGYDDDESSINLSSDRDLFSNVKDMVANKKTPGLKYIIVIGIGGSNLGTKAIYDALYGYFDLLEVNRFPKMIFVDTNNPEFLHKLEVFLTNKIKQPEEIIVNIISKSGSTTETIVNMELIFGMLEKRLSGILERFVVTTNLGGELYKIAKSKGISTLSIPEKVGGRYSVLSAVSLFPLAMSDINIRALLNGANEMRDKCLSSNIEENLAMASAVVLFENSKKGININNNFVFNGELESLGKWYRQLIGESIGKEKNRDGEIINFGITPIVSVGSADLHSVGQLYMGGPKDKITTFIRASIPKNNQTIAVSLFPELASGVEGKTSQDIMNAILEGVKIAYKKKTLPFVEIIMDDISEKSLGEFLQFKMMEIIYLGKLLNINPFDQPNVEDYKSEIRNILK